MVILKDNVHNMFKDLNAFTYFFNNNVIDYAAFII